MNIHGFLTAISYKLGLSLPSSSQASPAPQQGQDFA
jgi:hypothetical protein